MLIYIIAGEPSGDLLGGRLMAALRQRAGDSLRFAGIGGAAMAEQGLDSLFPMADLTVMGLAEVLPRLPRILKRLRQTMADIEAKRPDAIVTIDSWGFTGKVQKRVRERFPEIARIHYVAPMVWAWKAKRTKELAGVLDLLMCLLPNEPPLFQAEGLRSVHVGHPVIESGAGQGDGAAFRARHGLSSEAPLLCVLPGSRMSEAGRLLPLFAEVLGRLAPRHPGLTAVVPTVETVAPVVRRAAAGWAVPAVVVEGAGERYGAFAACRCAMAASGTVALELALAGLPAVITYRVSAATAFVARRFMGFKIKYANLVNILMDAPIVPELLQEQLTADALGAEVERLLSDADARAAQVEGARQAMVRLGHGGDSPSLRAADTVLGFIAERRAQP